MRTSVNVSACLVVGLLAGTVRGQLADPPAAEPVKEASAPMLISDVKPAAGKTADANAAHDSDAVEAFDRFIQAMKDAKSLTFKVSATVESADERAKDLFAPTLATVKALRTEKGWAYRVTGTGRRTAKSEEIRFDLAYAEGQVTYLDEAAKKMHTKAVGVATRGKPFEGLGNLRSLSDLFTPTALAKERAARVITTQSDVKVGETECRVVSVSEIQGQSSTAGETRLSIGATDHLLRRIERERPGRNGPTTMTFEFTEVTLNPSLTASDVELSLPEGYTKDAPATPTAKPAMPAAEGATPKAVPVEGAGSGGASLEFQPADPTGSPASPVTMPGTTPPVVSEPGESVTPAAPMPSVEPTPTMEVGPAGFELKTMDGAAVTLETLRGQPAVVVFGGSWSLSTRKALPELKTLAERYQGKARVYVAAVRQRDPKALATLVKEAGLDAPVLVSADTVAEQWRVAAFPSLFVLGPEGEFLLKPTTTKIEEVLRAARASLDTALNMTPEAKEPEAQESAPAASKDDAAGGSAVKPE